MEKLMAGSLEKEKRIAFNKMLFWGGLSAGSTILTCVNPVFVAAAIPSYYKFVRSYQTMENLKKQLIVPHG